MSSDVRVTATRDGEELAHRAHRLVLSGEAASRPELAAALGVSPATASALVRRLLREGLVTEEGQGPSSGGRRPRLLRPARRPGHFAVAELGARYARLGICDGQGVLLQTADLPLEIEAGVGRTIDLLRTGWEELVRARHDVGPRLGTGLALPGPVDAATGLVVSPSRMPGWSGAPLIAELERRCGGVALIDNDARAGGLGEWANRGAQRGGLLYVKAGTGIGGALIVDGVVHRGGAGIAGDVTHTRVGGHDDHCSCGNRGCLETMASGAAVRRDLARAGLPVSDMHELVGLALDAHPLVTTTVRSAGVLLGDALAPLVNFLNPDWVVIGGALSSVDAFVAGVRGEIYDRCLPMCTQDLVIERSPLGPDAALWGLAGSARALVEAGAPSHEA